MSDTILAALISVFIPLLIAGLLTQKRIEYPEVPEDSASTAQIMEQELPDLQIAVLFGDGQVRLMELEQYITGVVLQEMPAAFEFEALKAQAVVSRTYALRGKTTAGKHDDADVCADSSCCQAYISQEEYLSAGGKPEMVKKVTDAVMETQGNVLAYEGKLIEATYFSCSGGRTEDALAVWGSDVPYLRSVESPGEENAAHYSDTVTFPLDEFAASLDLPVPYSLQGWIGPAQYTEGGGIDTILLGGISFSGKELRSRLGLRSTNISIEVDGDSVIVTTMGFGHRVGMSQYGADAMAVGGSDCAEILAHYYPGAELMVWIDKEHSLG